jgi:outer membrane protein assembly factor BamB
MSTTLLSLFLLISVTPSPQSWPQFRGPTGDGMSQATDLPLSWTETRNIAWKAALPGRGRSSPVAFGDRLWMTMAMERGVRRTQIGPDDMQVAEHVAPGAVCVRRSDGRLLWHVTLFEIDKPDPVHWLNCWATPTPVVDAGRLYCDFGTFGTACLDAQTGRVVWKRRLPLDHQNGPGSSAILWRDALILVRDGRDAQYVTALDKKTGRELWKTNRPPLSGDRTDMKKSYSTPLVIEEGGSPQMVVPGAQWVASYDPASGKEIWRARHGLGFSLVPRPVFGHGLVYICTGYFVPQLWAIRVDGHGDVTGTHVAWRATRQVPTLSSPIMVGDELYWISDAGIACCVDARTGKLHWQERLGGRCLASPIYAAGRLYFFNEEGKTTVLKAGKQFSRLAQNRLEGPLIATPAILGGAIFLRSDAHLFCIERRLTP